MKSVKGVSKAEVLLDEKQARAITNPSLLRFSRD
ncbi:MAG TPA: hypothetical protein ENI15_07035 [Spirochaetes bacterium]|nr:hypothetical protein [Spirochaetota bacterium]